MITWTELNNYVIDGFESMVSTGHCHSRAPKEFLSFKYHVIPIRLPFTFPSFALTKRVPFICDGLVKGPHNSSRILLTMN